MTTDCLAYGTELLCLIFSICNKLRMANGDGVSVGNCPQMGMGMGTMIGVRGGGVCIRCIDLWTVFKGSRT